MRLQDCEALSSHLSASEFVVQGLQDVLWSDPRVYAKHLVSVVEVTLEAPSPVVLSVVQGGGFMPGIVPLLDVLPDVAMLQDPLRALRPCYTEEWVGKDAGSAVHSATCRVSAYVAGSPCVPLCPPASGPCLARCCPLWRWCA
jgi:hypothetical protein